MHVCRIIDGIFYTNFSNALPRGFMRCAHVRKIFAKLWIHTVFFFFFSFLLSLWLYYFNESFVKFIIYNTDISLNFMPGMAYFTANKVLKPFCKIQWFRLEYILKFVLI